MNKSISTFILFVTLTLCFFSQEAFAKKQDSNASETEEVQSDGKRNTTIVTIAANPQQVHTAALEALASIGCKVKKDSATNIEAKRPNKVGVAVGSGGEKLFVEIRDLENGSTELTVVTKKTMVGMVGQKLWNEEVAEKIVDALK